MWRHPAAHITYTLSRKTEIATPAASFPAAMTTWAAGNGTTARRFSQQGLPETSRLISTIGTFQKRPAEVATVYKEMKRPQQLVMDVHWGHWLIHDDDWWWEVWFVSVGPSCSWRCLVEVFFSQREWTATADTCLYFQLEIGSSELIYSFRGLCGWATRSQNWRGQLPWWRCLLPVKSGGRRSWHHSKANLTT
jgi:hypothetical protein